jgi:hypothetical protein
MRRRKRSCRRALDECTAWILGERLVGCIWGSVLGWILSEFPVDIALYR